nr:Down syndrome critical region protein 3 homolog [Quercus suber]
MSLVYVKRNAVIAIWKWKEEGHIVRKYDLNRIVRQLRKLRHYKHALEEPLEGIIIVKYSSSISHYGVHLTVNGSVNLQIRGGSAGIIESLYGVVKPISILNKSTEVRPSEKIGSGTTEIPFSMFLRPPGKDNLERFYETFHGANISAQYLVTVDIIRGYLHKTLSATMVFIVESDKVSLQNPFEYAYDDSLCTPTDGNIDFQTIYGVPAGRA